MEIEKEGRKERKKRKRKRVVEGALELGSRKGEVNADQTRAVEERKPVSKTLLTRWILLFLWVISGDELA
jgi:hypothetical protein